VDDRPGRRAITAITSVDGFSSSRFHVAYGAAKAGIIPLVTMYSDEFGRYGIRVNCVVPGNMGGEVWDKPDVPFGQDVVNSPAPPRADGHREWRAVPVVVAVGPGDRADARRRRRGDDPVAVGFTKESLTAFKAAGGNSGTERHHAVAPPVAGTAGSRRRR
jgi:NAD(P)-dependent dehydrogenase (short-subunit alcohol dehydrogenase family)